MIKKKPAKTKTIGRSDKADFPEFELEELNIKVDSGAYTSAIHCRRIKRAENGVLEVIFLDDQDPKYSGKLHLFKKYDEKTFRSSNGETEDRFIITTKIKLHKTTYDIEMSLTFRDDMRFAVLIGRRFLSKNLFVVNPRLKNHIHKKSLKT